MGWISRHGFTSYTIFIFLNLEIIWADLMHVNLPGLYEHKASNSDFNTDIICPFPDLGLVTESRCQQYSACVWVDGHCCMADASQAGYVALGPLQVTERGYKAFLFKANSSVTMFGDDIDQLIFEVIQHEDYHLQIKIYDSSSSRYEVPISLNLPEAPSASPMYIVSDSGQGAPFHFQVLREGVGTVLFDSIGALTFEDQFLQISTRLHSTAVYGIGENMKSTFRHSFDSRKTLPIFARDQPTLGGDINEYGSHPYYMVLEDAPDGSTYAHSVLLYNSNAMEFSTFPLSDGSPALTMRTIGGILDLHFFMGPTPEELNMQYTKMLGLPLLPPYWSLGFQLSRWGYNSTDDVREVVKRTREAGIPQDVQTLDIDYMDGKKDFTINPSGFDDLPYFIEELHDYNIHTILILDPAISTDFENYPTYVRGHDADAYIKWLAEDLVPEEQIQELGNYMVGNVWPGETVFPDFLKPSTQNWWKQEIKLFLENVNLDGIWIDMNEPSSFGTNEYGLMCPHNRWDSPPYPTKATHIIDNISRRLSDQTLCMSGNQTDGERVYLHYDVHNLYGWAHSRATFRALQEVKSNSRPFVLSRSTFPGSGQYAVHWLGDNFSNWAQMRNSIIGMLDMNMFGIPMVGADICGFAGVSNMELCARWSQLGAFYPFSRNHNALGMPAQDPAVWPQVAEVARDALLLRYKYLPTLYTLLYIAHTKGSSVVRPMLSLSPGDLVARDIDNQFLWGDAIMIAPVLEKGAVARDVYFTEGIWYDLVTLEKVAEGPVNLKVNAPLEKLPLYVRGGSILPHQEPATSTALSSGNPMGLTVALNDEHEAQGSLFWDKGSSLLELQEYYMAEMTFTQNCLEVVPLIAGGDINITILQTVEFLGVESAPNSVTLNGSPLLSSAWEYQDKIALLVVYTDFYLGQNWNMCLTY